MSLAVTSEVRRPPTALVRIIERRVPGFWQAFGAAVAELDRRASGTVTSWWRDRATNERVGGSAQSQHLLGTALDVTGDLQAIAAVARAAGFVVVVESDHVHLQAFAPGQAAAAGLFRQAFAFA